MASEKTPIGTKEAGKMLGVQAQTVVRLIRRGEIPGFQVGDVWRLYREDVEAYIQKQMEGAVAQDDDEEQEKS